MSVKVIGPDGRVDELELAAATAGSTAAEVMGSAAAGAPDDELATDCEGVFSTGLGFCLQAVADKIAASSRHNKL